LSAHGAGSFDLERVICRLADLESGTARAFTVGEGDWPLRGFVVHTREGVRAYVNRCPHAGHPLDLLPGRFLSPDGTLIVCASHGALFEKATGYCVAGPCAGKSLKPVPVEVRAGYVLLADDVDASMAQESPP
jgi:nitrite reductase/ring-hydroxylating ferredoxin subunit